MSFDVISTKKFTREIKRLVKKFPSLKQEYATLIDSLEAHPIQGTLIGNDCYKIRVSIASKGKGKSGGARIITNVYITGKTVFLLTIYDKSEQDNITPKELEKLLKQLR